MKLFVTCIATLTMAFGISADVNANAGSTLWASTGGSNSTGGGRVYTIDPISQTVTLVGNSGLNRLAALDFDNSGNLYGVSGGAGGPANLYTLSTIDASPTFVGTATATNLFGIDAIAFDSSGTLFATGWAFGRLLTLNPTTASVLTDIPMSGSGNRHTPGLAIDPADQVFGSRGNSFGHTEDLVSINTSTGVQTGIGGRTNVISDIWFAADGTLYGGSPTGALFTINPTTGAKTFLFNTGIRISGLTGQDAGGVEIDIKPGKLPNRIKIKPDSNGKVPVAILSTTDFDAPWAVNRETLTFGPSGNEDSLHRKSKGTGAPNCRVEDVSGDGLLDLNCFFIARLTGFLVGDTVGILKGQTLTGDPFEGSDSVVIVAPL